MGAVVLTLPHLGWYINFVCPYIDENYVFAYPDLAPLLGTASLSLCHSHVSNILSPPKRASLT